MPGYDVMNGLAEVGPLGFIIGALLTAFVGYLLTRK